MASNTKTEKTGTYAKLQAEAVLAHVKGVEMKDYSDDPIAAHQSVNLVYDLGRLPEQVATNDTGLRTATDTLKTQAERHVGHKAEAGYGHDDGNWAINLAFPPEAKQAVEQAMPELKKQTARTAATRTN